eukprot:gene9231-11309_t
MQDNNESYYKLSLPSNHIEFSSEEGKIIFREAIQSKYMEGYFVLAEHFTPQSDLTNCSLATLAMVLNSLRVDPQRIWKGTWRWFVEDMLPCCMTRETITKRGMTFKEFACLSRCNGANVEEYPGAHIELDVFREFIKEGCSTDKKHLVLCYNRKALGQVGTGHYSPIGGYHKEKDLVLIMDVARFKYPTYWVPVEAIWESIRIVDGISTRGFYMISSKK